jgi:16S rRNA (adenine1518-N6/adenine1519-N6)-dimethyltransferase
MQTLIEVRSLLDDAGARPNRRLGQCFLIDAHAMEAVLDLAELSGDETVLEVGPGTGSLTEELLDRADRVVAVELDRRLSALLARRLDEPERFTLLTTDVLAGKHRIEPAVGEALGEQAVMVANLPYAIATPLVAECLASSWRRGVGQAHPADTRFSALTFMVQREVADRLTAQPGSGDYGPVSVLVALLATTTEGPVIKPTAFWPRPKVHSRIVRIDLDPHAAQTVTNLPALQTVLSLGFGQRRKQLGAVAKRKDSPIPLPRLQAACDRAGIDPSRRAEQVTPEEFLALASAVGESDGKGV